MSVNKRYFDFNKGRKPKPCNKTISKSKLSEEELEKVTDEIVKELYSVVKSKNK